MVTLAADSEEAKRVDAALSAWRQGDFTRDETWFVHVGDGAYPLTDTAAEAEGDGVQALTSEVMGLVVVSQTCDIVRGCTARPFVEVAPLVDIPDADYHQVKKGRRPALAALPNLEAERLVVDLDRVMTVEKSVVATWRRTPGHDTDYDARVFAQALARKRARFAFPDDFTALARKLQHRLTEKHDKATDEGRGLRALREIRIRATPSWDAPEVELLFWFIRNDTDATFEGKSWADLLPAWLKFVSAEGRFRHVYGQVSTLRDMTAEEYNDSDPLDLDHLSTTDMASP